MAPACDLTPQRVNLLHKREREHMNFEPHAAEALGGAVPQVRYRATNQRFYVVWQGEMIRYRDSDDVEAEALRVAEGRIMQAIVGLFASDQLAQLSSKALGSADDPTAKRSTPPRVEQLPDGRWRVADDSFEGTYDDGKVARAVAVWLIDESDTRSLADVIAAVAPTAATP